MRGDQKVRGKVLFHRIAFIDCNENSWIYEGVQYVMKKQASKSKF